MFDRAPKAAIEGIGIGSAGVFGGLVTLAVPGDLTLAPRGSGGRVLFEAIVVVLTCFFAVLAVTSLLFRLGTLHVAVLDATGATLRRGPLGILAHRITWDDVSSVALRSTGKAGVPPDVELTMWDRSTVLVKLTARSGDLASAIRRHLGEA